MPGISVFHARDRAFEPYPAATREGSHGHAQIARLVGRQNSQSMGGGVAIYERLTVDWDLPFDEFITVIEGSLRVISAGVAHDLGPGDLAWFPAHTPLTYEVAERAVVSYAIFPLP